MIRDDRKQAIVYVDRWRDTVDGWGPDPVANLSIPRFAREKSLHHVNEKHYDYETSVLVSTATSQASRHQHHPPPTTTTSSSSNSHPPTMPFMHRSTCSFASWLSVAYPEQHKSFEWRFCVLHATALTIHLDDQRLEEPMAQHEMAHVGRLDYVSQGFYIVDNNTKQQVWLYTDSECQSFEMWLAKCHQAIVQRRVALERKGCLEPRDPRCGRRGLSHEPIIAGCFLVRRVFLASLVYGRKKEMQVVLRGRHLTAFAVDNALDRWTILSGMVTAHRILGNHTMELLVEQDDAHLLRVQLCMLHRKRSIDQRWIAFLQNVPSKSVSIFVSR